MIRRNARKFTSRICAGTGTRFGLVRTKPWASKCIWQVKNGNSTSIVASNLSTSLAGSWEAIAVIFCTALSQHRCDPQYSKALRATVADTNRSFSAKLCRAIALISLSPYTHSQSHSLPCQDRRLGRLNSPRRSLQAHSSCSGEYRLESLEFQ